MITTEGKGLLCRFVVAYFAQEPSDPFQSGLSATFMDARACQRPLGIFHVGLESRKQGVSVNIRGLEK